MHFVNIERLLVRFIDIKRIIDVHVHVTVVDKEGLLVHFDIGLLVRLIDTE